MKTRINRDEGAKKVTRITDLARERLKNKEERMDEEVNLKAAQTDDAEDELDEEEQDERNKEG